MFSWVGPAVISTCTPVSAWRWKQSAARCASSSASSMRPGRRRRRPGCPLPDRTGGSRAGAQLGVGLGRGVAPHGLVHRRRQGDLRVGGQHQGGQQVVGHALDQARHEVGGSRCDQHQIGPAGQFDVAHRGFRRRVQQIGMHRMAGQRLEGQGVMNSRPPWVITTRTSAPWSRRRRTSSALL